jgi:hypothetical protein
LIEVFFLPFVAPTRCSNYQKKFKESSSGLIPILGYAGLLGFWKIVAARLWSLKETVALSKIEDRLSVPINTI